jgi:hypothetical protein
MRLELVRINILSSSKGPLNFFSIQSNDEFNKFPMQCRHVINMDQHGWLYTLMNNYNIIMFEIIYLIKHFCKYYHPSQPRIS